MAQLEAEIMRLIGIADQSIREASPGVDEPPEPAPPPPPSGPRIGFWLGALTLLVVMLCGALLGATYYHQLRMSERMKQDLTALQQRLLEQAADEQAALEVRIKSADRAKQNLGALQAELRANINEFNRLMTASLRSMTALGATTDLERQRPDRNADIGAALRGLRERAASVARQLDQVADSLSVLAQRLPDLDSGVDRLAQRLEATTAGFERVESQVATIQAQAPELALWLEGQRQALAQDLEGRRQSIGELATGIATLQGALDDSRSQLVTLEAWLEQSLAQAKPPGGAAGSTPGRVPGAEQVTGLDGRTTQQALQERIDALLAGLAEKADLAALHGEELVKQGEAEAARRLETATAQAIDDLSKAHEARLAELTKWASATQDGLGQTRARLIADWRGMDEAVAKRQSEVLRQLDEYAATLEVRVQELLKVLDVIAARSGG
jgi:chromosome segregation ATPase